MKYDDKIDRIIEVALEQKRLAPKQKEKVAFARSIFVDLLKKTDKDSLEVIKNRGATGKIGWTPIDPEMLEGLIILRETVDANPELRKTRRRRTRNTAEQLQKRRKEVDMLYDALLNDTTAKIQTKNGTVDARVEMRIIYSENDKQRIRIIPAALGSIKVK